jgi:glutaminase
MIGRTAMHLAACNGHVDVIKYLLAQHAETSTIDEWGKEALIFLLII